MKTLIALCVALSSVNIYPATTSEWAGAFGGSLPYKVELGNFISDSTVSSQTIGKSNLANEFGNIPKWIKNVTNVDAVKDIVVSVSTYCTKNGYTYAAASNIDFDIIEIEQTMTIYWQYDMNCWNK